MNFQLSPSGRGSADQWVREQFGRLAAKCRARHTRVSTGMFVLVDADKRTVQARLDELDRGLALIEQPPINASDPITRLVPKRNIETWILHLTATEDFRLGIHEDRDYKGSKSDGEWSALIPKASEAFLALTRSTASLPSSIIDSLQRGIRDLPRALAAVR